MGLCTHYIAAPDISGIALPSYCTGYDPDYESSLSSLISGAAESLVSGSDEVDDDDDDDDGTGDGDDDDDDDDDDDEVEDKEQDSDKDENSDEDSDGIDKDDEKDDVDGNFEEPYVHGAAAEPWQGRSELGLDALSAEERLQSLQSGMHSVK